MAQDHAGWALIDPRTRLDREAASALMLRHAGRLGAALPADRRFTICAPNCAEHILAMGAGLLAGRSGAPVSAALTVDELAYALRESRSALLFVGPETAATGLAAAQAAGVTVVVGWRCERRPGLVDWAEWSDGPALAFDPACPAQPQYHFTSGTTGLPKGTLTPPTLLPAGGTIGAMIDELRERLEEAAGPALIVGPLNHTGPLSSFRQFLAGRPLVVMERFDAETFLQQVEAHRIAAAVMVPTHFQRLLALPAGIRARYDVSSLREITHTGSRCPIEVKRAMIEWFGPILVEGYGATEVGATNYISSEEWLAKPGSVGRTLPPFELLIVGDDDEALPAETEGRIYFRDTTGRGIVYPEDPAKTRAAHLVPGTFTLGDRGHVDDDGYLFVTGRSSDMVISGGVNIYPTEIERVLLDHPDVADVAAIGIPHPDLGEQVLAIIVPRDPANPPLPAALTEFAAGALARYKLPRSYRIADSLGRTDMGKLNKAALAARLGLA